MSSILKELSGEFIKVSSPIEYVLLVELSRGPVNAFTVPFWKEYGEVFRKISLLPDVRAVVLASSLSKGFSAGLDFSGLDNLKTFDADPGRKALQIRADLKEFQEAIGGPEKCLCPVIVAVHGITLGLSIDIMAACDVRYAASDSMLSIKEVDVGLAADIGTLARLPKLAGNQSMVHEFAYTARNFSAAEAEKMGLVSKVVEGSRAEVVQAALETAKLIATKSPIAVLGTKKVLQHARDHTVAENMEYVAVWNGVMLQSSDLSDSFAAAIARKKATFPPLFKTPAKL
ncbi:ClpP/crotonase-like domain-containing protein [Cristinia sonorae]|uniref:ClpP/crotonase-like domain-containing protein n=1 Tax=Cristinia sonorae TaxID=1940300 RepID=A0A8K0XLP0_9AGAR|nr:ClpP/crotonase-like domain-containing protein [Cristinia sonorae]